MCKSLLLPEKDPVLSCDPDCLRMEEPLLTLLFRACTRHLTQIERPGRALQQLRADVLWLEALGGDMCECERDGE